MMDIIGSGQSLEQSIEYVLGLHFVHLQRGLKLKQFGMFLRDLAELPQSPTSLFPEQVDEAASHTRPVLIVHPDEPQIQPAVFGAFPLIWVHSSPNPHVLVDLVQ